MSSQQSKQQIRERDSQGCSISQVIIVVDLQGRMDKIARAKQVPGPDQLAERRSRRQGETRKKMRQVDSMKTSLEMYTMSLERTNKKQKKKKKKSENKKKNREISRWLIPDEDDNNILS